MAPSRLTVTLAAAAVVACGSIPILGGHAAREVWGFHAPWDVRSERSSVKNGAKLDVVVTGWIALDTVTGRGSAQYKDSLAARLPRGTRRFALVTSSVDQRFRPQTIRSLASNPQALARVADDLGQQASVGGYSGLVLDFEEQIPSDLPALTAVVKAITDAVHARGIRPVVVAIPAGDTAGYPAQALLAVSDLLLVMLYDEHWATSPPGPIASPEWVRRTLSVRVAEAGASRLVAALPLYGYRWRTDSVSRPPVGTGQTRRPQPPAADPIGYADAQRLAAEAGVTLSREPGSSTLRASRTGAWELWVSDAELLRVLVQDAERSGINRFALWRLGQEDPAVWNVLRR